MKTNIAGVMLQNMEHCPGAVSAFKKNLKDGADKAAVAKAAKAVDSYLAIEDKAKKSGATEADVQKMKGLIDNAKSVISKAGLEGHTYHDMHLAKVKKMMKEDIQSADKKPEKYVGPDGKTKIRMVPTDRQVVKKEANMDEISLKDLQKKVSNTGMSATKKAGNMDKTKNDLAALKKRLSALTPVKEAVEDDEPASPDEAGMAMDQAKFIAYVAEEIMEYIEGNNEFPEWMQNKLSALHEKAKGMHAVMAGKYEDEDGMNEDVRKMSHGRLKFHMNNKNIPHGSHSFDKMKAERDRRLATGQGDAYKKAKASMSEEVELDEAPRRKGAPKMTGDSIAIQRAKDAKLNKALGRTKTGRKKPERTPTSTQRSLAQLRGNNK